MSDHRTTPLHPDADDLLQAALSDPFSVPSNLTRVSPTSQSPPSELSTSSASASAPTTTTTTDTSSQPSQPQSASSSISVSPAEQEAWKAEYEAHVAEWRRQSADVRARAEIERARWEERRARERAEQAAATSASAGAVGGLRGNVTRADTSATSITSVSTSEWEAVSQRSAVSGTDAAASAPSSAPLTSPEDSLSSSRAAHTQGTHPSQNQQPRPTSSNAPARRSATGDPTDSPHWENLPSSPTSSFPSMSFPEPSRPHSPEQQQHQAPAATTTTSTTAGAHSTTAAAAAASMTLAVFDNTLPASTRFWAFCSSLSINFFLPFVNGVMLGFGEIFAKTVIVEWLGWGPSIATSVGLGVRSQSTRL